MNRATDLEKKEITRYMQTAQMEKKDKMRQRPFGERDLRRTEESNIDFRNQAELSVLDNAKSQHIILFH